MEMLVTYDVETLDSAGARRLRKVAKICEGFGYRVQKSVFEVLCDPAQQLLLAAALADTIDQQTDSVRMYSLGAGTFAGARHLGAAVTPAHRGPLII